MKKKNSILVITLLVSALTAAQAQTSGTFGEGLTWALSGDGTLTISGNGAMPVSMSGGSAASGGAYQPWELLLNQIKTAVIEDGVSGVLSVGAFEDCTQLTQVTIGKGITEIRDFVFRRSAITSIVIPEQITEIAPDAFTGADKLETVYFNAVNCKDFFVSAYSTGPFANTKTQALKTVVFGDAVIKIPEYTCVAAHILSSVTVGKSVTVIGAGAFWGCIGLTSIAIPDNVQTINYSAFRECSGLTSIDLGNGVTQLGINAFTDAKLTELTIPASVTEIRHGAFGNFARLETVYFNATNCENLDVDSPFEDCEILTTIVFGDNVRRVPQYIAEELEGLESVTIGRRVTTLGHNAFAWCNNLMEVINNAPRPQTWGWNLFDGVDMSYCVVRVPAAAVNAYKAANKWKDFTIEAQ